ncbi:DUF475 domain-containing protein [Anianabacter salinae]|uniref:DUF475 domain-containing protein n=1 Tax=Anianabacter salinae TaxID=2851023 RepID=UPI00225E1E9C|nr:DUF475 domain-containing protein [Anianabacter salinae]MBV0911839.1 DUF475 domain-containing protein [Anianabacter salinae]
MADHNAAARVRSGHSYFIWPGIVTVLGLALGGAIGYAYTGTVAGFLEFLFICSVLAVLEISLSFDNAIVNANKLKTMRPEWQRRFLTWGILIAVFGMRIVFPLLVVCIAARIGPIDAVVLAASEPQRYSALMEEAHLPITAFGGTFLMMVALSFFCDADKDVHWFGWLERRLTGSGGLRSGEVLLTLVVITVFSRLLGPDKADTFLYCAVLGLITFLLVEALGTIIDKQSTTTAAAQGGLGAFLYLEVLDASFSFDGVIGAFALSTNLFIIAIGLGIGAMYVRSMTIFLVDRGTLSEYRFLEHGAFYAIFLLAIIMFAQSIVHVPEVITGLIGAAIILFALYRSLKEKRDR